ncbi:uncharacterized protein LOC106645161, partial [Copidosoma floridanum]|uniref:uncharacterized protein LOC106645161 n=1 Tax=Copidosoma floridanum TaxID=29053 RepID=UPI000C6FB41F
PTTVHGKREDRIHVPWSSAEEWLQVYKQIYSGDLTEQNKAYETLLVWKARITKLPVGIECTLNLLQVCLRDREWTPKIYTGKIPVSYENDLRMLYSTVIMKFLNYVSNIANNKQTSLFVVAKQMNIPDWIVDLRHDVAHGHELPSIDVMRVVANILLSWVHEEYWAEEAKNFEESEDASGEKCFEDEDNFINLIELWIAVKLYLKTDHVLISDLPDTEIRDTLNNSLARLNASDSSKGIALTISDDTELTTVSLLLLSEISKNFNRGDSLIKREKMIIDLIVNNEAFLTNSEILSIFLNDENVKNCLPHSLIEFWKDLLLLLQEKKMLLSLFLHLLEMVNKEKDSDRKLLISLWIKCIAQAYNRQKIARNIFQTLEQKYDHENQKKSVRDILKAVQKEVDKNYPEFKSVLCLNVNGNFPKCLTDEKFIRRLVLNFNEYSEHYLPEILKISSFLECDAAAKEKILALIKINSTTENNDNMDFDEVEEEDKIFTVKDLQKIDKSKEDISKKTKCHKDLGDCKIRNKDWKIASNEYDWSTCPIGILPWQTEDVQSDKLLTVSPSEVHYAIVKNLELPKIVDSTKLKLHSKIKWENLLKKKKKTKRKSKLDSSVAAEVDQCVGNTEVLENNA